MLGHAFYSSLRDLLQLKAAERQTGRGMPRGSRYLEFTDIEVDMAAEAFRRYLANRISSFEINFIRITGLISALKPSFQLPVDAGQDPWWIERREFANSLEDLRRFVTDLESIYTNERLEEVKHRVTGNDVTVIMDFLRQLPEIVERHRTGTPLPREALQQAAEEYVRAEFATEPLTCLGVGEEGVVLTDGRLVYKYFHYCDLTPESRSGIDVRILVKTGV